MWERSEHGRAEGGPPKAQRSKEARGNSEKSRTRCAESRFEEVQRHELSAGNRRPVVFSTELTRLQRKVLRLLAMVKAYDT